MSTEIIKVLDAICEKFGIAIDWTSQNVMPYLEQVGEHIVQYKLWTSFTYLIFTAIALAFGIPFGVKKFKKYYAHNNDDVYIGIAVILTAICLLCIPVFIIELSNIITTLTFPEKTILDFIITYTQN